MALDRWILCLADDLTGALETGSKFAAHGLEAAVVLQNFPLQNFTHDLTVSVLVIDTETRHDTPTQAHKTILEIVLSVQHSPPWLIYKKTDSTLRGNIAAELNALKSLFADRDMIYSPAYPEMGRTVREGRLFVWDQPVHETAFAADPYHPIRDNHIMRLLGENPARVLDGSTSEDLHRHARLILEQNPPALAAGAAALAEALAECIPLPRKKPPQIPRGGNCLVVNGSQHPASAAQIASAQAEGCFDTNWRLFAGASEAGGRERALHTGEQVKQSLASTPVDTLIVFGGDTAYGIHSALRAGVFEPLGDIVSGVPFSRCAGLNWITKAGGFGAPDLLCELRRKLA